MSVSVPISFGLGRSGSQPIAVRNHPLVKPGDGARARGGEQERQQRMDLARHAVADHAGTEAKRRLEVLKVGLSDRQARVVWLSRERRTQ